jgi:hypothetical protein
MKNWIYFRLFLTKALVYNFDINLGVTLGYLYKENKIELMAFLINYK